MICTVTLKDNVTLLMFYWMCNIQVNQTALWKSAQNWAILCSMLEGYNHHHIYSTEVTKLIYPLYQESFDQLKWYMLNRKQVIATSLNGTIKRWALPFHTSFIHEDFLVCTKLFLATRIFQIIVYNLTISHTNTHMYHYNCLH